MNGYAPGQMRKIFSFTFSQNVRSRGYRVFTVLIALLMIVVIPAVMAVAANNKKKDAQSAFSPVTFVAAVEAPSGVGYDWNMLKNLGGTEFSGIEYEVAGDIEEAARLCAGRDTSLIVILNDQGGSLTADVLLPEGTALNRGSAQDFADFLQSSFPIVIMGRAGFDGAAGPDLGYPVNTRIEGAKDPEDMYYSDGEENTKAIAVMVLTYATVVLLYFLILIYGQQTARSTMDEKVTGLMDTFLVSVRPRSLVMGKVLAIAASGLLQLFVWAAAAALGLRVGALIARAVYPEDPLGIVVLFKTFGALAGGMFSVAGVITALLAVVAGFLLYCSLAAFGGSMASRPEDLGSANMLFTLLLLSGYLMAVFTGAVSGNTDLPVWMYIYPLSAVLVTPAAVLAGTIPVWLGVVSLLIIAVCAWFVTVVAGKTYVLVVFFRGNPPGLKKVIKMLRGKTDG